MQEENINKTGTALTKKYDETVGQNNYMPRHEHSPTETLGELVWKSRSQSRIGSKSTTCHWRV